MLELAIIPRDLLDAARKRKEARREAMSDVCREFGISRKTGYKIYGRYKEHGLEALIDRELSYRQKLVTA